MRILANSILLAIVVIMVAYGVDAGLSKAIYPGCTVVEETGRTLTIEFGPEINRGTDASCEKADRVIRNILRSGFKVKIQAPEGKWTPYSGRKFTELSELPVK